MSYLGTLSVTVHTVSEFVDFDVCELVSLAECDCLLEEAHEQTMIA
jgi:hypothetical protein